ncbi:hypothetical protein F3Y22_tig00117056pilonHSYRG00057 [Hibiscus syriacus]|uniref:DUF155 domain-containing protein n=1 Tax=Hibiscus syriacus TaxID=106335 RepID=A0A6A2W7Y9_HIBSY|nr:hypothetical protein F3Y22_tig00117056pilonHSYRG00057 [Hibiscus syriacus]
MGRWRAVASSILLNYLNKLPFPSHKFLSPRPVSRSPSLNPVPRFLFTTHFCALSSQISVYTSDFDHESPEFSHQNIGFVSQEEEEEEVGKIPIKACLLCTSIDLKSMQAENLSNILPSRSSNHIALRFCDFPPDITALGIKKKANHEVESHLEMVRKHFSGLLTEMRRDDYTIKEQPLLTKDMQGGPDYIVLKTLDTDSIRVIGSVLGQSIALDYFVSHTGTFTMDRTSLIKLVGKAKSNLADVILKVGLFERSEIAWREAKYAQIYEYLREEYEVTQRFGNLDFKLKFVEHNIRFLQEVIQNRRSDLLEWCIIFLFTIENVIAIYEIVRESTGVSL